MAGTVEPPPRAVTAAFKRGCWARAASLQGSVRLRAIVRAVYVQVGVPEVANHFVRSL